MFYKGKSSSAQGPAKEVNKKPFCFNCSTENGTVKINFEKQTFRFKEKYKLSQCISKL